MFYIFCLRQKKSTEYTGIEYYISTMLKVDEEKNYVECEEIQWFPDLGGNDDEGEVEEKFQQLKAKLLAIR